MLPNFIKQHKLTVIFLLISLALIAMVIDRRANNGIAVQNTADIPEVTLLSTADYRRQESVDLENATVESLGQANLKAQTSGAITQVNVKLGDRVAAGLVLMQLQNSEIKAQLEQARAGLVLVQARLEELQRGSRAEDLAISQTSANETKTALVNSIKDAYAKSDDAIHNHIDKFFTNPRQSSTQFLVQINIPGAAKVEFKAQNPELAAKVEKDKYKLEAILSDWQTATTNLQASSNDNALQNALEQSQKNLQMETDFLNDMAQLVNSLSSDSTAVKTIIDGYKTEFSAARNTVSGSLGSLQAAETAWKAAQKALDYKLAGSSAEQIEQGNAAVNQAQASVDALKAALAKTSVISPIEGRVSYINGNIGEYITAGSLVAEVVNPAALRVKTYISESDLANVAAGAAATIGDNASGIVETVSPAVNSQTKKAEVNIVVTQNGNPPIVVGQNVSVKISRSSSQNYFLLPIEAIQFTGSETYALSVGPDSSLIKVPVVTGQVIGEQIYVVSGINDGSLIVSSVRGLEPGKTVTIRP